MRNYLAEEMIFIPDNLPRGRFPTRSELRNSIHEFGYSLEEGHDWYVTSEDDGTEIWFRSESREDDFPIEFWFRRGGLIVLNIAQSLTNKCGSFLVASHSGSPIVLLVPDMIFPTTSQPQSHRGFIAVMSHRLPVMIERLPQASLQETLFILCQIRQPLQDLDYARRYEFEFFQAAQQGLSIYLSLLNHEDSRVRYLAFDLIVTFRERLFESAEPLRLSIKRESDSNTKALMIKALEKLGLGPSLSPDIDPWTKSLLEALLEVSENTNEALLVRFDAINLLVRVQPGLLTPAMHTIFIDALTQPDQFAPSNRGYGVVAEALKSIEGLLLNHRIEILITALPQISVAQDAHDALRALLDYVFFGQIRFLWMSSLPDTHLAERPEVDETKFRDGLSRSWLYPVNPTKLTPAELLPFQRSILEMVLGLDLPWMVHSNLLEKYGLPPSRALTRTFLGMSE